MLRRLLILLPALALIVWLVAAQLPLWTAPQPDWFAPGTPGVCAAVESLRLYAARRVDSVGIGREAAQAAAAQMIAAHYGVPPLVVSEPLAVEAALPGDARRAYAVVAALLSDAAPSGSDASTAAVIYLDATGEPRALITTVDDPAAACDFDVRAALVDAVKSPPLLLLAAYVAIVVGLLLVHWFSRRRLR
ncbi:MAG: hypothetical protein IT319_11385 [Anaerolineae bacterium]|nr:hypothetical protein [Anaerolineae bacterium]